MLRQEVERVPIPPSEIVLLRRRKLGQKETGTRRMSDDSIGKNRPCGKSGEKITASTHLAQHHCKLPLQQQSKINLMKEPSKNMAELHYIEVFRNGNVSTARSRALHRGLGTTQRRNRRVHSLVCSMFLIWLCTICLVRAQEEDDFPFHCGCATCTQTVWDQLVVAAASSPDNHNITTTCGQLIRQAQTEGMVNREEACTHIATKHADACGACHNLQCPLTARAPSYCGCWYCGSQEDTVGLTATTTTTTRTCGDRIDQILSNNPLLTEWEACVDVAGMFPDSCGKVCHPVTCQQQEGRAPLQGSTTTTTTMEESKRDRVVGWTFAACMIAILFVLLVLVARYKMRLRKQSGPETVPPLPNNDHV